MKKFTNNWKDLCHVLVETGFSKTIQGAYQKLQRLHQERGKFTPPKDPISSEWKFTEEQMVEIAKAFGPGGTGEWHFN